MAALAVAVHVSLVLASAGVVVAAVGEPCRVAKQLFAVTEGFFGPVFFVWLGAGLQLNELVDHPSMVALVGSACAALAHLVAAPLRQPASYAMLATAQLGYPSQPPSAPSPTCPAWGRSSDRAGRAGHTRGRRGGRFVAARTLHHVATDPPPTVQA
jgi:hypothetical protein